MSLSLTTSDSDTVRLFWACLPFSSVWKIIISNYNYCAAILFGSCSLHSITISYYNYNCFLLLKHHLSMRFRNCPLEPGWSINDHSLFPFHSSYYYYCAIMALIRLLLFFNETTWINFDLVQQTVLGYPLFLSTVHLVIVIVDVLRWFESHY